MHNFKVLVGFQAEDFKYRNLSANRNDMLVEDLPVLDLTSSQESYGIGGAYQKWRTTGFFGRINYDYDGKYLFEGNIRYDGSSRFRAEHRWVWSPSFSVGWNVDREKFWSRSPNGYPPSKYVIIRSARQPEYQQLVSYISCHGS